MTVESGNVAQLLSEGDKYYEGGNYRYAMSSYSKAKAVAPGDAEVLARHGLAVWNWSHEEFARLMAKEGISEPDAGYMSLFTYTAWAAAGARFDELENVTQYAAENERSRIAAYRLAWAEASSVVRIAAVDLLAGSSSTLATQVGDALRDMEARFPGTSQKAREFSQKQNQQEVKKSGPCFVATAVYGSPYAEQVVCLRQFRDEVLCRGWWGRAFVWFYGKTGPVAARLIENRPRLKASLRRLVIGPLCRYLASRH